MKSALLILLMFCLLGCQTVASYLPTVQHCDEVDYKRKGDMADITAKNCRIRG